MFQNMSSASCLFFLQEVLWYGCCDGVRVEGMGSISGVVLVGSAWGRRGVGGSGADSWNGWRWGYVFFRQFICGTYLKANLLKENSQMRNKQFMKDTI